jgi:hypothetical protein
MKEEKKNISPVPPPPASASVYIKRRACMAQGFISEFSVAAVVNANIK